LPLQGTGKAEAGFSDGGKRQFAGALSVAEYFDDLADLGSAKGSAPSSGLPPSSDFGATCPSPLRYDAAGLATFP
jgi:hypothetical protein